jgi:hypothetical protein
MNPVGFFVPSATIFPRKRIKAELFNNAPEGTVPMIPEGRFINKELFIEWLKHFAKHAKPKQGDPVILIVDSHFHTAVSKLLLCADSIT